MVLGVWENIDSLGIGDAFLIALIAILIVFAVIVIIIVSATLFQKGIEVVQSKTNILPRKENQLLEEDEDAVVALIAATIDFHKEFGKDCRVKSIERLEE